MSTTDHPPLHVAVVLPPAPYALATSGFLATLAAVEAEIASIAVKDAESAQQAATIQSRLTSAGSALEKQRKALKDPFIAAGKAIDEAARGPSDRIEAAKAAVKAKLTAYDAEQRRIAAEAEAKRQAELRALREKAEAEAKERQRIADEQAAIAQPLTNIPEKTLMLLARYNPAQIVTTAKQVGSLFAPSITCSDTSEITDGPAVFLTAAAAMQHADRMMLAIRNYGKPVQEPTVAVMDLGDDEPAQPTATQAALAALESAPAVVAPKPAGVSMRVLLVATVTDINKLPEQYIVKTANMAAIRARFCQGFKDGDPLPVCEGVKFEVSRSPVSTGRPVF